MSKLLSINPEWRVKCKPAHARGDNVKPGQAQEFQWRNTNFYENKS